MYFDFVIETTRKCNQQCFHCLRGKAQNIDMPTKYIDIFFEQLSELNIDCLGTVTFSGGEPTLNPFIIDYFLNKCKEYEIALNGFYIATNGAKITDFFIMTCLKLYAYCDEKEFCMVQLSNDDYHEIDDYSLLEGLSFFSLKYRNNFGYSLISEGNAKDFGDRPLTINKISNLEDLENEALYLNCNGQIINGCNWSYQSQKNNKDILFCQVEDFADTVKQLEIFENELI